MKKSDVVRWIFTTIFGMCVLGNGVHWSSLMLVAATVLMAPIPFF